VVPNELRGQPEERRARSAVLDLVDRAIHNPGERDAWLAAVRELHELAAAHRLHEMAAPDVERIALGR
jgi:hypothetical protein